MSRALEIADLVVSATLWILYWVFVPFFPLWLFVLPAFLALH